MKLFSKSLIILSILFIASCVGEKSKQKKEETKIDSISINKEKNEAAVKKIFFNLPSPVELTQVLLQTKEPYKSDLLNPVSNLEKYNTSTTLALNFGVYGADLCYCRVYDQLQDAISYLSVIRKITDKLQIPEEEGSETINRIESSMSDRDSIFRIISETYASADSYLKENERDITAALILVGGWTEGMHFAVELVSKPNVEKEIINRVAEQKYTLDNLILLISEYKENAGVAEILPYFVKLQDIYKTIEITHEKPVMVTDKNSQVTTIDTPAVINITSDQLKAISELVNQIRFKIVS
jgi:hypothetical protein